MNYLRALPLSVDRSDPRPLPLQLAQELRRHIMEGLLPPGYRIPSTRALAKDLAVSRSVVEHAFDQIRAEGWIEGRAGSGTFVSEAVPTTSGRLPSADLLQLPRPADASRLTLRPGIPWTSPSATAAWRRAWRNVGSLPQPHDYPDPAGPHDLRIAVSDLLARVRGVRVTPDRVVITTGATHGMTLTLAALRTSDDFMETNPVLAMEDPGYRVAASAARALGWRLHDVPVDSHGMRVDLLDDAPSGTRAVYVTPSHQYPTGGTLDVARRGALIDFARSSNCIVIEDDYDSEYRYDVAPLPALAQLDTDRVVYLGTIAKTLGAGIRLGWVVPPRALVAPILAHRRATADFPSVPVCDAVRSIIEDGEWDRSVRAARRRYRYRDADVRHSLAEFGELRGLGAGMHTTLMLHPDRAAAVADTAARHGVDVPTLAESTRSHTGEGGLVIGYGRLDESELIRALAVIADALRAHP